ncbi:MAG: GspH/FimT family pseudopilin [Gemmatimonadota bacterium]
MRNAPTRSDGFTVVELAISLATTAILLAIGYGAMRQYAEATTARKVAVQIAADIALTRSHAIQRRENVSLVARETQRDYVVRDLAGTVFTRRSFGAGSDLVLTSMVVSTAGDSLTFNSRGLLLGGTGTVTVARGTRAHDVLVNALGRTDVN